MVIYCKGLLRNNSVSVLPGYTPASYNEKIDYNVFAVLYCSITENSVVFHFKHFQKIQIITAFTNSTEANVNSLVGF